MLVLRLALICLAVVCVVFAAPAVSSTAAPTPQPMLEIAQKLLSNIGRFPSAIQEGMSGKTGEIRKIVSSALGGGLIGQLVENPIQAAGNFGIDLDQFGINKTMLENSIGATSSSQLPNFANKGDLLFSNQMNPTTTTEKPKEVLYIDGRPVPEEHEDVVLTAIKGEDYNRANDDNRPSDNVQSSSNYFAGDDRQFYQRDAQRRPIGRRPAYYKSNFNAQAVQPRRRPFPPPVVPEEPGTTTTNVPNLMESMAPFFNHPPLPHTDEAENNDLNNNEIAPAVERMISGRADVRRAPFGRHPEFHKMNAKIQYIEQRLNEQQELLSKQNTEEKEAKIQKILETLKYGRSPNRLSALQKHLRYSPEAENEDLRLSSNPLPTVYSAGCECAAVDLSQLKGRWFQALGAKRLITRMSEAISKLFDSKDGTLDCSELQVSPARAHDPAYAHFVWSLRLRNATNTVRLPGNIFVADHNQFVMRLIDFNSEITDIPICVHKVDESAQYLVVAESEYCQAATLLVKSPETLFKNTNSTLTTFLQSKIGSKELDRMELVEHVDACSAGPK